MPLTVLTPIMRYSAYFILVLAVQAFTIPLEKRGAPAVTIPNGTVIGSTASGVDSFKGIPFAQAPIGSLRLKPPQPLSDSYGTIDATSVATACPQLYIGIDKSNLATSAVAALLNTPLVQTVTDAGEDCLTLDIMRPAGTTSSSSLPVVVWIFGGGFEFGSTQLYDGTNLVSKSIDLGSPVVYVAMNYRVGGFGFLGGQELANEGSTNLGLRDQRLALQWVQDNIAAFGGDPSKVTLWGESAGSISAFDHTVINGGDISYQGKPLFRGAIMESGSVVPAEPVTGVSAQNIYNTVVESAGCSSADDTLACLRSKDYTTFLNAVNSVPSMISYRSLDLSYLPRPDPSSNFFSTSPELSVASGAFAKVPIIIGDQEDEGTLFSLFVGNITNNDELVEYVATYFPANPNAQSIVAGLASQYPDDFGISGSPFNTGLANNIFPQYKRLAAILGDITFILSRRVYLSIVSSQVPAWSYLSSYLYGLPVLGTFHVSDIPYAFGYLGDNVATTSIQTYYISFINTLDPNAISAGPPLINWPQWSTSSPQLLNFQAAQNTLIADDFRQSASQYLLEHVTEFRV